MKVNKWLMMVGLAAATLASGNLYAQDNQRGEGRGRGNWDPAEFQRRMMEGIRERMEVKDDAEWKVISARIEKVMEARRQVGFGFGGGFGRGRGGGDGNRGGGGGGFRGFGEPSPEAEALNKAIESKASASELKAALAKYRAARKEKQAALEKAQAELQKVLSVQQEAVAVTMGLVN